MSSPNPEAIAFDAAAPNADVTTWPAVPLVRAAVTRTDPDHHAAAREAQARLEYAMALKDIWMEDEIREEMASWGGEPAAEGGDEPEDESASILAEAAEVRAVQVLAWHLAQLHRAGVRLTEQTDDSLPAAVRVIGDPWTSHARNPDDARGSTPHELARDLLNHIMMLAFHGEHHRAQQEIHDFAVPQRGNIEQALTELTEQAFADNTSPWTVDTILEANRSLPLLAVATAQLRPDAIGIPIAVADETPAVDTKHHSAAPTRPDREAVQGVLDRIATGAAAAVATATSTSGSRYSSDVANGLDQTASEQEVHRGAHLEL